MAGLWISWRKWLCINREEHAIHFDLPPVLSSLFQLHPDCGSHRKKCSTNMAGPRTHLLGCISKYHSTSRCLVFLTFSLSASLSEYSSKLLLCCSSQDDCNAVAIFYWVRLGYPRWPKNYRALSSARSYGKTIMNYHVEFEHVQTAW